MTKRPQESEKSSDFSTKELVLLAVVPVALAITIQKIYDLVQEIMKLTP